ncbi:hypothetical protein ABW19_dt0201136 [Dactylella cylindrospora]|nr:hypothetical protein ABW19_dt0201136 [Dactylella cylindrospora]
MVRRKPQAAVVGLVSADIPSRRHSVRTASSKTVNYVDLPSPADSDAVDGEIALRASPTASEDRALSPAFTEEEIAESSGEEGDVAASSKKAVKGKRSAIKTNAAEKRVKKRKESNGPIAETPPKRAVRRKIKAAEAAGSVDEDFAPNGDSEAEGVAERPPAVNDDYRPIPFKGRLGFACLNTYLRSSNPPIFCSRTCRIDTILKHDTESGPGSGMTCVKSLGHANATDLCKLIKWNQKYNIKFLRISSEMFPFASHAEYGYNLEHAAEPLKEAGRLAMEYGHRLTMHPGQYTQLGSPRPEVVENAIRDLEYHRELLDRLQLTGQADRDAVMIIHMGGIFGDKVATIERFKQVYTTRLSSGVKNRLVLENDDVCWSVEDLLPTCQELNIPLVLDWHHNNIVPGSLREGTYDVNRIHGAAIKKTWTDKGITQKQHYSEPREGSVTNRDRRRHSARVVDLPPCEDTMDLMIEAKDKEQAVFEVMRRFEIDGWEEIGDVLPFERTDENVEVKRGKKKGEEVAERLVVPEEEVGMGGAENRVYWPEGKEEWLRPKKKVRLKKDFGEENGEDSQLTLKKSTKKAASMVVNGKKSDVKAAKSSKESTAPTTTKTATVVATNSIKKRGLSSNGAADLDTAGSGVDAEPSTKRRRTPKAIKETKRVSPAVTITDEEKPVKVKRRSARTKT